MVEQLPCSRCGTFIPSRRESFYSQAGQLLCRSCHEVQDLDASTTRYVNGVRNAGYGGPTLVLAGFMASPFVGILSFLLIGIGVLTSAGVLLGLLRDVELRHHLGNHRVFIIITSGLAVFIGGSCLGLAMLGVGLGALAALTR